MIRQPLDKALRRALEATVVKARDIAEQAATQALKRLSVGDAKPADYLSDEQRKLRTRLRAHGRQQGDSKDANSQQSIHKLVSEVAYEHWHRMLFARFLEQNHLLMYDEHTPLTLAECNELVQDPDVARDELERHCQSGWELAGVLASKMLPQIFRIDSPVFELELAPEHQRSLEQLVTSLALETFQAQDSLGWVYQFWQSKRKEEVNKSEVKIGADELSPVTQLFTESYMVSFLLDNSLGAWWAGQRLSDSDWQQAGSEQELRDKAAIPGVPLSYLRFVKDETTLRWQPASGTFDAWPKNLSELKTLDPCCGSGHFLVAAFLMLVPMRMELDGSSARDAVDAVLQENIHGLELDQRCVELAAFSLALNAWSYPGTGGYRMLPELNVACSGLSISAKKSDWVALAGGNTNLELALEELHRQFKDASVLGSLVDPEEILGKGTLFELSWAQVGPLLGTKDTDKRDDGKLEMTVVAKGLVNAAELLSKKYEVVATNVPYLVQGKQCLPLRNFSSDHYPSAKNDLATVFISRCRKLINKSGVACVVSPQNWLFQPSYKNFRKELLSDGALGLVARLGSRAFESIGGEIVKVTLSLLYSEREQSYSRNIDVSGESEFEGKSMLLKTSPISSVLNKDYLGNEGLRITHDVDHETANLSGFASTLHGQNAGDNQRFIKFFWETQYLKPAWEFYQNAPEAGDPFSGRESIVLWEQECGRMAAFAQSVKHLNHKAQQWRSGKANWSNQGVALSLVGKICGTLYEGDIYGVLCGVIIPNKPDHRRAVWAYVESGEFEKNVRELDSNLAVQAKTLLSVPFDFERWDRVALSTYPNGLPQPHTNAPTQWIFHGHPCGSVIWDEQTKWTAHNELRVDDSVLQIAVARLLGYRWPAELDVEMELAAEQRAWVRRCQELDAYVDDDGIVCLPAVRGEKAADQRLETLLQAAYGEAWTTPLKNRLLETVGSKSLSLWLRDKFFEQHCKLFQHRPFIWHIWDGLNDGFSALVNYHKLDKAGLERLIYTYLGDWIRTQQAGMASGEDGAQERLIAAEALERELEAILEGEAPYDIFVRWKPQAEQPIGWTPDLNDGVRLNIRPFLSARAVSKKGAGILRWAPNIKWTKDRGKDVDSAPWYTLGLQYGEGEGARINDHHLSLAEKKAARS